MITRMYLAASQIIGEDGKVNSPTAEPIPGDAGDKLDSIVNWIWWIARIAAVGAFGVAVILILLGATGNSRMTSDGVKRIGWILGAVILLGIAPDLINFAA